MRTPSHTLVCIGTTDWTWVCGMFRQRFLIAIESWKNLNTFWGSFKRSADVGREGRKPYIVVGTRRLESNLRDFEQEQWTVMPGQMDANTWGSSLRIQ